MPIDFQPMNQDNSQQQSPSIDFQPMEQQSINSESTPSNVNPGMNMPGFNPEEVDNTTSVSPQMSINPGSSDFNIGDVGALAYLKDNPQDQQNYLQKKFPYVIPQGQGNFLVGKTPGTSKPINVNGSNNGFFGWLASQADQIPSMVGMSVGATVGTAIEPGAGTVVGAGLGAAGGEAIAKGIGAGLGSTESLVKDGVDVAISGAFGAVGQKAAQMFGLAAGKIVAPNLAKAVDAKLTSIVNNGGDPSKFINFVSQAVHFASGANKDDVSTLLKYGVNKTLADPAVKGKDAIINIAQEIMNTTNTQRQALGTAVGETTRGLMKFGKSPIQSSPIVDYLKKEITSTGMGTIDEKTGILQLNRNAFKPSDTTHLSSLLNLLGAKPVTGEVQNPLFSRTIRQAQSLADSFEYDINNPSHQVSLENNLNFDPGQIQDALDEVEANKSNPSSRSFRLPNAGSTIPTSQAIRIRNEAGELADAEDSPLGDNMRRIFSNVVYGDGKNNAPNGISSELSRVASENGLDKYVANNMAYSKFMKSLRAVQNIGLDPYEPTTIEKFASGINGKQPISTKILSDFENNVGTPVLDNLRKYGAVHNLETFQPNFLRLGMVSGLLGGMIGGGDLSTRVGRGMGFGLLVPGGLKVGLKGVEAAGNTGANILKSITSNSLKNKAGTVIASQKSADLLRGLINNNAQQ